MIFQVWGVLALLNSVRPGPSLLYNSGEKTQLFNPQFVSIILVVDDNSTFIPMIILIVHFKVPETKDRSLGEIEEHFRSGQGLRFPIINDFDEYIMTITIMVMMMMVIAVGRVSGFLSLMFLMNIS